MFSPTVDKLLLVFIALIVIYFVVRILQNYLARRMKEVENRYRMRKGPAFTD